MKLNTRRCMWCGACVGICPKMAITLYETRIEFNENCIECGICVRMCPVGAISMEKGKGQGKGA